MITVLRVYRLRHSIIVVSFTLPTTKFYQAVFLREITTWDIFVAVSDRHVPNVYL